MSAAVIFRGRRAQFLDKIANIDVSADIWRQSINMNEETPRKVLVTS